MEKERLNPRNIGLNTGLSGPDSPDFEAVAAIFKKKEDWGSAGEDFKETLCLLL
jgi:hypothetical protein